MLGRSGCRHGIDEIHGDNRLAYNDEPAAATGTGRRVGKADIRDFDKCHEFFETFSLLRRA
jgi:hypothetical protein